MNVLRHLAKIVLAAYHSYGGASSVLSCIIYPFTSLSSLSSAFYSLKDINMHQHRNHISARDTRRESAIWMIRLARVSPPRLFRLARLLLIRMMVRSSASVVDDVARDLENISAYVEAQMAAGRPISSVLDTQADALHHRLQNLAQVGMQQGTILTLAVARGPWRERQGGERERERYEDMG